MIASAWWLSCSTGYARTSRSDDKRGISYVLSKTNFSTRGLSSRDGLQRESAGRQYRGRARLRKRCLQSLPYGRATAERAEKDRHRAGVPRHCEHSGDHGNGYRGLPHHFAPEDAQPDSDAGGTRGAAYILSLREHAEPAV